VRSLTGCHIGIADPRPGLHRQGPADVWCKTCLHRFEPDTAELVEQHGAAMTVMTWARWLRCSLCGAREADFVVSGSER
jgi:hypothetical protein